MSRCYAESRKSALHTFKKENKFKGKTLYCEQTVGKEYSGSKLFSEVEKDILLYDESSGGVTFSGGEPLQQYDALIPVLMMCKKNTNQN